MPTLLTFPTLNQYSTPLLILVIQGYVFAFLLLRRYQKTKHLANLFLAFLLIILGYHRTTYIIGFMGWYDTFRNTKINYVLIDFLMAVGPLLYFYVKSITLPNFKFKRIDWWHFVPTGIHFVYKIILLLHDSQQPGFNETQNGVWFEKVHMNFVAPIYNSLTQLSFIVYFTLACYLYFTYRKKIKQFFSNTLKVELTWLRNFLVAYAVLFIFMNIIFELDDMFNLSWTQRWWGQFAGACTLVYLGTYGYFTNLDNLFNLNIEARGLNQTPVTSKLPVTDSNSDLLLAIMKEKKPYLNTDLTLGGLAAIAGIPVNQLSHLLNSEFNQNFNEFINAYRVDAVKDALIEGKAKELSLIGIAYEAGFNSKATFNRTFKKITGQSPSEFLSGINR